MPQNNIRMLCSVLKVDMVYEAPDFSLIPFFSSTADSPLMQAKTLRDAIRNGTTAQKAPYLYAGDMGTYYAGLRAEDGVLMLGPMCTESLNYYKRQKLFRALGFECSDSHSLKTFTMPEIRNMILLTNTVLKNAPLENEELLQLNRVINQSDQRLRREQTRFVLNEEEQNDDEAYRHSYQEEQLTMQAIREGRTEDALRQVESMDSDCGRFSSEDLVHWRTLAIMGITLCARAAIEGGITPEVSYRVSGYYIQKCNAAHDAAHLLHYRNRAIEELSGRVAEKLNRIHVSSHVERCKAYVRKHYREKIYLEDIADALGISRNYLSALFKEETGVCLQDYINEERVLRACNLLMFSDLSLTEIATYVHFPSQSYFGKIFKKHRNMTPKEYRDRYRPPEIVE